MPEVAGGAYEITADPPSSVRLGVAIGVSVALGALAAGCLLAALTQGLTSLGVTYAVVIGGMAAFGSWVSGQAVRAEASSRRPTALMRLDHEGVHLLGTDPEAGPVTSTVPWEWIASVSRTTLDARASRDLLGSDVALDLLRFVLADDRLLDGDELAGPVDAALLRHVSGLVGLTPRQTRLLLAHRADRSTYDEVVAWLSERRPTLPVITGTRLPWWAPDGDRGIPGPRVAVIGAGGRLGRQVVAALVQQARPVVAVVRDERDRAALERLGAEVRMVDLRQGHVVVGRALQDCGAIVMTAPTMAPVVVDAAVRGSVARLVVVSGGGQADDGVADAAAAGLAWTAFAPLSLTDDPPTGEVALGDGTRPGPVPRADLAQVLVAAITDENSFGASWPIAGAPARPPSPDRT